MTPAAFMKEVQVTEQDRATARRIIRRHVGAPTGTPFFPMSPPAWFRPQDEYETPVLMPPGTGWPFHVVVRQSTLDAAAQAAALGRAYGRALRTSERNS